MHAKRIVRRRRSDAGFALVLAILALMLLTFLGLTLAVTTSTELQIATNYRWSQQAFYNAEAGLEAGRLILANTPLWQGIVPFNRTPAWPYTPGTVPAPPTWTGPGTRNFESRSCDYRGGQGYGVVLNAAAPGGGVQLWENISSWVASAQTVGPLNGAFTLWVRRELQPQGTQLIDDATGPVTTLVLTAEGVAPYIGAGTAFTKANQARRLLEMSVMKIGRASCRERV